MCLGRLGLAAAAAAAVASALLAPSAALAGAPASKVVRYHGYRLVVPQTWPVYHLQTSPGTCVRFNRHAVYLGTPSKNQSCPAHVAGRTEAILVSPLSVTAGASGGGLLPAPTTAGALPPQGSSAQLIKPAAGVTVTATWQNREGVIRRALGVGSLPSAAAAARSAAHATPRSGRALSRATRATAKAAGAGAVYTGLGVDICSTPNSSKMAAWGASPYRAVGVYIGGTNMACSQPNLTSSWVGQQSAAGWHLIPIYVGLQAPSNDCGCSGIASGSATSEGRAAASDAIAHAQAIGLGPGNPIYFDMEGYNRTTSNTNAVMNFLAAWTSGLHAGGYISGVYSSADSGIGDLANRIGTGYPEPDDIWIARWNGLHNTSDPNLSASDWADHQRLHQYRGDHNETYGGVTMDVDSDYLDGATAASGAGSGPLTTIAAAPSVSVSPQANGNVKVRPSWPGVSVSTWQVLAGATPTSLVPVTNPAPLRGRRTILMRSSFNYFAVAGFGPTGQRLGASAPVATPRHVAIFGKSAFVPRVGQVGLPVGCFSAAPCRLTTALYLGTTRLVRTGPETIGVGGGLVYFKLYPAARAILAHRHPARLPVTVVVRDVSGMRATSTIQLTPFFTSGPGSAHGNGQAGPLRLIGATEFVSNGRVGGLLAGCFAAAPCQASFTMTAAGQTIARTGPQMLGVNELGYLFFTLTNVGHQMLLSKHSNRLPVRVKIALAGSGAAPGSTSSTGSSGATGVGVAPAPSASASTVSASVSLVSFR
jgi:Domain of unknown function (DUF1906)